MTIKKLTNKEKHVQAYYKLNNIILNIVFYTKCEDTSEAKFKYLKNQEIINLILKQQYNILNIIKPEATTEEIKIINRYFKENKKDTEDIKETFEKQKYKQTITEDYLIKNNLFNIKDCFLIK
jgi:hypothetical protein